MKVTKIVRKHRNSSASPSAERKLSTGSQSSQRSQSSQSRSRRAPQERQPIMVASIANFDHPKSFKSVKPPKQRTGTQTDFDSDSDFAQQAEISISIQTDAPPNQLQAVRKRSADKIVVDVADGSSLLTREESNDVRREEIAESPQLFIPPTPPLPETPPPTQFIGESTEHPPAPPTPLRERKAKAESKADQMIESHSDLLLKFPPPPETLMKKTPETIRKSYTPTLQEGKAIFYR